MNRRMSHKWMIYEVRALVTYIRYSIWCTTVFSQYNLLPLIHLLYFMRAVEESTRLFLSHLSSRVHFLLILSYSVPSLPFFSFPSLTYLSRPHSRCFCVFLDRGFEIFISGRSGPPRVSRVYLLIRPHSLPTSHGILNQWASLSFSALFLSSPGPCFFRSSL